jgi:adenylate kinase family enzyme
MRFAIIGNSGSGKSTLAASLASLHAAPLLDLDTIAWVPGKIAVPRDPQQAEDDLRAFCSSHQSFVVEGCYETLIPATFPFRPTLIFLDVDVETCVRHCLDRPFEPHKYASPAEQDEKLAFLLDWVRDYYTREGVMSRAEHIKLFDSYQGPKARYHREVLVGRNGEILDRP